MELVATREEAVKIATRYPKAVIPFWEVVDGKGTLFLYEGKYEPAPLTYNDDCQGKFEFTQFQYGWKREGNQFIRLTKATLHQFHISDIKQKLVATPRIDGTFAMWYDPKVHTMPDSR